MDYHTLYELCANRKSCRAFQDEALTDQQIEQILKLAHTAPIASGRKNWRILVVKNRDTIRRMAEAVEAEVRGRLSMMDPDYTDAFVRYAEYFSVFKTAGVLFVPVFRVSPSLRILMGKHATSEVEAMDRDNMTKSISCVAMLILLAAESLGLGACYTTGGLLAHQRLTEILQLPAGQEIGAIIPVGIPEKQTLS